MIRRDMPLVLVGERAGTPFPWDEEMFLSCLRRRNCIGMVAETTADEIIGHMIYELFPERLNVLNFTVHSSPFRETAGDLLAGKLVHKLSVHHRREITIVLRESDIGTMSLLVGRGFRVTELLRSHYEDSGEDGVSMKFTSYDSEEYRPEPSHNRIAGYLED
jgi:ribosomal-protein-alanine N-acetyltransferase